MLRNQDEHGRYPLSLKEYEVIRMMFATVTAFDGENIRERCELIPGLWETIETARDQLFKGVEALLKTIPAKKLIAMQHELQYTVCKVEIKPPSRDAGHDYLYIPRKAYIDLLQRAIQLDCVLCEKTIKECKKCRLYRNIDACFPYLLEEPSDTLCPFAGVSKLEVRDRQ